MLYCYPDDFLDKEENENYKSYIDRLYFIFKTELLNKLSINGRPVRMRQYPPEGFDREEAFYHLTCTDYERETDYRRPDFQRSKRLNLIKPLIENVMHCPYCLNLENCSCPGILIWKKPYKKNYRYHLWLQDKDFLIVLEDRKTYYLLVTSFYVKPNRNDYYYDEYKKYKVNSL